ncbi:MAG: hypothetical protein PHE55_10560 [Methylococcaceae bacterium]|nr:hypothetical protein [Methylococcaceae bacterium]
MANNWSYSSNPPTVSGGFKPDSLNLLMDGSVLVHLAVQTDPPENGWFRLTPDIRGSYESGTWSTVLGMAGRQAFSASGLLQDGRVFVAGGKPSEASDDSPFGEIFDLLNNRTEPLDLPDAFHWLGADVAACILADGRVLFGAIGSARTALWDPLRCDWLEAGLGFGVSEATTQLGTIGAKSWTLLPDGSVLSLCKADPPIVEKYVPSIDRWIPAGSSVPLTDVAMPVVPRDGRLLAIDVNGHTAFHTPSTDLSQPGAWTAGPDFPVEGGILPSALPALLLPDGKVLCLACRRAPNETSDSLGPHPGVVLIYDPASNAFSPLDPQPTPHIPDAGNSCFLLLPTGQVLFTAWPDKIAILTPDADIPCPAWKPTITIHPTDMVAGQTYVLGSTQFNPLAQDGGDGQITTHYPIVRLTHTAQDRVVYLPGFNVSTLGITAGATMLIASLLVPADVEAGQYELAVITDGIASDPVTVQVTAPNNALFPNPSPPNQDEIQALIERDSAPAKPDAPSLKPDLPKADGKERIETDEPRPAAPAVKSPQPFVLNSDTKRGCPGYLNIDMRVLQGGIKASPPAKKAAGANSQGEVRPDPSSREKASLSPSPNRGDSKS